MFGHDKDEKDEKKKNENLIHPVDNKPVSESLMGVESAEKKVDAALSSSDDEASNNQDKDIEDIVGNINASTSATNPSPQQDEDDDDKSQDDVVVPPSGTDDSDTTTTDSPKTPDDLMDIKKSALEELSPLIDQLDQTPEEKTNTLLMMIQATDDKSHIPDAFKAARDIKDDKKRAQAMLDIINEINYFTHKKN